MQIKQNWFRYLYHRYQIIINENTIAARFSCWELTRLEQDRITSCTNPHKVKRSPSRSCIVSISSGGYTHLGANRKTFKLIACTWNQQNPIKEPISFWIPPNPLITLNPFRNTLDKSDRKKFDEMFIIRTKHEKMERVRSEQLGSIYFPIALLFSQQLER